MSLLVSSDNLSAVVAGTIEAEYGYIKSNLRDWVAFVLSGDRPAKNIQEDLLGEKKAIEESFYNLIVYLVGHEALPA